MVTIDYGLEVAGLPIFNVESFTGKVQVEVKYSEEFAGLESIYADGPFPFNTALSNSYRVETFEITSRGRFHPFKFPTPSKIPGSEKLTRALCFRTPRGLFLTRRPKVAITSAPYEWYSVFLVTRIQSIDL